MTQNSAAWSIARAVAQSAAPAPEDPQQAHTSNEIIPLLFGTTVDQIERELVLHTLVRCHGNRTRAARMLGLSIRTLRNKIRLYAADGIDVPTHCDD